MCGIASITQLNLVKIIQYRAIRYLCGPAYISKYKFHKILSLESLIQYFSVLKVHNILNSGNFSHFRDKVLKNQVYHNHNTRYRNNNILNLPICRKSKYQHCFLYIGG